MYSYPEALTVLEKVVIGLDMEQVNSAAKEASRATGRTAEALLSQCIRDCLKGYEFDQTIIGYTLRRMVGGDGNG